MDINNNKTILTDKEVDEVSNFLGENVSEESKKMRDILTNNAELLKDYNGIPENTEDKPYPYAVINKGPVIEGTTEMAVDPATGILIPAPETAPNADISASDMENFEQKIELKDDSYKNLQDFGLSNEDIIKFMKLVDRYKSGEKFSVYNEMPDVMKKMVRTIVPNPLDRNMTNRAAKDLMEHFLRDLYTEEQFVDLQAAIKKELDIPNIAEMYEEHLKDVMEIELLDKAAKLDEAGYPDKAQALRDISKAFIDSYTYALQEEALKSDEKVRSKISKDLSRYKKFCNDFNYKYYDSKFKVSDIKKVEQVLARHINYTIDDIKKFIILLCKVTAHMIPENVAEHSFMYYSIKNILSLDYLTVEDEETSFRSQIIDNICRVIDLMKEVELEYGSIKGRR